MSLTDRLHSIDRRQQKRPLLSFVAAVFKKFSDDGASQLAALIAYYGFFSLFPLLLVFVTVLGFVLQGNPSAQSSVLHSTLSEFPIIGNQLQDNVHSLKGSGHRAGDRHRRLDAGRPGHNGRHPERLQPGLVHTPQAPPQLPHLAPARAGTAVRPRR